MTVQTPHLRHELRGEYFQDNLPPRTYVQLEDTVNAINWFEIPVNDLERAVQFYTAVLGRDMPRMDLGGLKMALFPADQGEVGGALCMQEDFYKPSSEGSVSAVSITALSRLSRG